MTPATSMNVTRSSFGSTRSGCELTRFACTNKNGYSIELIDYGATVTAVRTPDRHGNFENIVLDCNDIHGYEACTCYFGSVVGRVCNRIAGAKFSIAGIDYSLVANDGPNHLHGGLIGFDKLVWQGEPLEEDDSVGVQFKLISDGGDEGYPGQLNVTVIYRLNNDNELWVEFEATTNEATHVNLTSHSYWNLGGATSGSVRDHELMLNADQYLSVDDNHIPTGQLADVAGSPLDFRAAKSIGHDLDSLTNEPIGYDHCFEINRNNSTSEQDGMTFTGVVTAPESGRKLEILTTQPSVQLYTGNYLNGQPSTGSFEQHTGFCLETQGYVDAANQPTFPPTLLKPGETYQQRTIYRLSVVQ